MKKSWFLLVVLSCLFVFLGCEVGMGASVDLEPPVISVKQMKTGNNTVKTSFETSIYCNKYVIFSGIAQDNLKVTNVKTEIKWSDEDSYHFLKNATLDGDDWSVDLELEKNGACSIKFVAEDKSKNFGTKSSAIVTLFVDNDAPADDSWYIDRLNNGIQYSMQSLTSLKNIIKEDPELTQPANIDVAQNVEFDICSAFSDSSGIKDVYISIFDESGNKVVDKIPNASQSNYAPKFHITHDMLVTGKPSLASGLHYLQVRYSAEDTVTDPEPNKVQDKELPVGWFIWWPQSDNPKYSISDLQKDAQGNPFLSIHIGDSLSITVFDDDALTGNITCKLEGEQLENSESNTVSVTANENERERVIILHAPTTPQKINLIMNATAKSGLPLNNITIPITVSDDSSPTLILTSPKNNEIPTVISGSGDLKITFDGIAFDKAKCDYLEFVWVPDEVETIRKREKAEAWLNSIAETINAHSSYAPTGSAVVKCTDGTGEFEGMKLWSAKLSDPVEEAGHKKSTFAFELPVLDYFISGTSNETNKDKYFLIRLTRNDEKYSDSELVIAADNLEPEIIPIKPAGNLAIVDPLEGNFNISFKTTKQSGVPVVNAKLYYVAPNGTKEEIGGSFDSSTQTFTSEIIAQSTLEDFADNNENPKYQYYAIDQLGNEKTENYDFIISSQPAINSITSTAPSKCKKDDDIYINVSFTKTVVVTETDKPQLKLKGIKNGTQTSDTIVYADYSSGSGSTTLVFCYKVKENDESNGLQVYNETNKGPIKLNNASSLSAHLNTLPTGNNLQEKRADNPITINGIVPKVSDIQVTTEVDAENRRGDIYYLRAGRTITATVTVENKKVTVQGAPTLELKSGDNTLSLAYQKISYSGVEPSINSVITFSKKILAEDQNGEYTYDKSACLIIRNDNNEGIIKDDYNNELENPLTGTGNKKFYIDTVDPVTPVIYEKGTTNELLSAKYQNLVEFTIENTGTDIAHEIIQYSTNGGMLFSNSSTDGADSLDGSLTKNATLVAKIKDFAGNTSPYSNQINIEIESSFPDYTVECLNADGRYKAGAELNFKVYFDRPVNIPANSTAYIALSDNAGVVTTGIGTATLVSNDAKTNVSEVAFKCTISAPGDFTLKIKKEDIHLTGFTDEYDFGQNNKAAKEDYSRPNIICDVVSPKVIKMEVDGSKDNNIYDETKATKITLTFSENVQLGTGKLYLRQVKGWAIPPVLTASEFNTICAAYPEGKNILSVQEDGIDMEDSAWDNNSDSNRTNSGYHGTGQYVGPYKKSSMGITSNGSPDTSTKYVLDFDVDIWETNTTRYYDKTFTPLTGDNKLNEAYRAPTNNPRTADNIRDALESAHYHERYMSVTAANITNKVVELNFPAGLFGETALPYGRKWELVIEKGAFLDDTGNKFGAEVDGSITQKDAIQTATGTSCTFSDFVQENATWGRGRENVPEDEKPVVLIRNGNNDYFWSDNTAIPVIRVDRYSFGNGIFQSNSSAEKVQITTGDNTVPTGYVRVRIDCETEGATITYNYGGDSKNITSTTGLTADFSNTERGTSNTYMTNTTFSIDDVSLSGSGIHTATIDKTHSIKFAIGSGVYNKSYKGYIKAKSAKTNHTSNLATEIAQEGVFQTVVCFVKPTSNWGNDTIATHTEPFSIRGTTGTGGEATISPFPLRDNQLLSSFIRQTYKERTDTTNHGNSNDYYWVSYEILVNSTFSGHCSNNGGWISQWGLMKPGEFTYCDGMVTW